MRLLLVEDDLMLASGIKLGLTDAGYEVDWAGSAERAQQMLSEQVFSAAVIDIGLPGMDGLELTRRIRQIGQAMPVLILTARDALQDRIQGLDLGADDYMIKPFELPELLARLRALLRRTQASAGETLSFGVLEIDLSCDEMRAKGLHIELGRREWRAVKCLIISAPKPVSKEQLLEAMQGLDKGASLNATEVFISRLRSKLEPHGVALRSVRGFGYRLELMPLLPLASV
jgi:DNA-binding response OmpR family regulator